MLHSAPSSTELFVSKVVGHFVASLRRQAGHTGTAVAQ